MVDVDVSGALPFLSEVEQDKARQQALKAFEQVKNRSGEGAEWLGWRTLLSNPNDAILEQISSLARSIRADADVFILCGIGGSYLGAKAVIEALGSFFPVKDNIEIIYAGHHMSGKYMDQLIKYISKPKEDGSPKSVYLNVVSKSGTTLETALSFRSLRKWMVDTYGEESSKRIICTTSKEGGALNKLIDEFGYQKFVIPEDIGGRFSVLTPVGLLPIAVAGIDIQTLFYGAVNEYQALEERPDHVIQYATTRYALHQKGKAIDVIGSFKPELHSFGSWVQQLLGESEGKDGKGMFPATTSYSTDLHSLGQMIQNGNRNMIETFINVNEATSGLKVEHSEQNVDELNYLSGKSFHEINVKAYLGTKEAHIDGGVPVVTLSIEKLNAQHVGSLIYFFELFTAIYVYCLEVNPFNQPGVEAYKKAMYQLLGKE